MENLYLIYPAMLLLFGTLVSALASKLEISNAFFLYFTGMILGAFGLVNFPTETIIGISSLAVVFVVFESTVKLKFKDINKFTKYSLNIVVVSFILHICTITPLVYFMFPISDDPFISFILSLVFSSIVYGIDHDITLTKKLKKNHKLVKILEVESLINRILTIVIPLLLLKYITALITTSVLPGFEVFLFFKQVLFGIIIGVVIGFFVLIVLNTKIVEEIAYLIVITSSIVTFSITEFFGLNGVLSLTFFSLIFGNYHVKHKKQLEKITFLFGHIFNIFVFILIGTKILISFDYFFFGTLLFLVYIFVRFVSVFISLKTKKFSFKEIILVSFNVPKGIDVAIIILLMMTQYNYINGIENIVNLCLLFSLYSITLSNVLGLFSKNLTS